MKNQQKLVLRVLAKDSKISKEQYEKGLNILESLLPEEAGKLNWIVREFQLSKESIMTAFQKAKDLITQFGTIDTAINSINLDSMTPKPVEEQSKIELKPQKPVSDISIQKGPTRLSGKSTYQQGEDFAQSKIKHAPKLKKQQPMGDASARFIDMDPSESSEDEGLFKSSDASRPLSDIKSPSDTKPKLKRASSKIIEPKSTPSKAEEQLILEAPPPVAEKQEKAFELEQIQVEEVLKGESSIKPPPMMNQGFKDDDVSEFDDVELDPIDDFDDLDDENTVRPAPPPIKKIPADNEIIELSDDEIDEV